ncbi:hypothetical protein OXPF_17180 [Oxobacter pfennigii]|uniref:DUF6429 domain-containing protein n=1 Tax=Oxobacter pfennigii TaxID=36849 RepID=A0A0N8NTE8_9CLOT|nr:DUF6429 family protein [Oxobacter pfennigii]KPU44632.1 hypothetical protein OXPF_17180 [Oxobacter pfennigii]
MEKEDLKEEIKELTLMLLYLTSWKENEFGIQYLRSWKGYGFGILNELTEEDLIPGSHRSKSVMIADEGIKNARESLKQYDMTEQ